jgi:hypothetical protein
MSSRFSVWFKDFLLEGGLFLVAAGLFGLSAVLQAVVLVAKLLG